jgi:GcrA cell cycle regulator
MSWTDERVETLKRMWSEGQSASQIAKELGGVTRNAVIGKVHRLGLSNRVGGPAAPEPAKGRPEPEAEPDAMRAEAQRPPRSEPRPAPRPEPAAQPNGTAAQAATAQPAAAAQAPRKPVLVAGQPLPPQPAASEISPEALASVREVEKKARRLTLMELTERTCKWPIGDPATDDFWFCGLAVQPGKP